MSHTINVPGKGTFYFTGYGYVDRNGNTLNQAFRGDGRQTYSNYLAHERRGTEVQFATAKQFDRANWFQDVIVIGASINTNTGHVATTSVGSTGAELAERGVVAVVASAEQRKPSSAPSLEAAFVGSMLGPKEAVANAASLIESVLKAAPRDTPGLAEAVPALRRFAAALASAQASSSSSQESKSAKGMSAQVVGAKGDNLTMALVTGESVAIRAELADNTGLAMSIDYAPRADGKISVRFAKLALEEAAPMRRFVPEPYSGFELARPAFFS